MSELAAFARPRVVVIGGGIAGLTAALDLAEHLPTDLGGHPGGADIIVLEGADRLGGKLRLDEVAGHLVDVGAESMLAVRPEALDLVDAIGAADRVTVPATTSASVWSRGALHPLPRATLMGIPADAESARGILDDAELHRLRDERPWPGGPLTEDVSVGDYVAARLGDAVVDRLVEPLLGGVYAGHARRLSLRATMPAVWDLATRGQSLISRPVAALPSRPPFAGLLGGVGSLPGLVVDHLRDRGVTMRTGSLVRGLERTAHGWRLVIGSAAAPEYLEADAVVLALPPAPAARLLTPHAAEAAALLAGIETASSAVVTFAIPRATLGDLPGSGFLVPPVEGRRIKASTFSSNKWAWTADLAPDLFFLRASFGRAREEADLQRPDDELVEIALAEVSTALDRPLPTPVDAHVQRWGGGLPQYAVGHVDRVAAIHTDVGGLPGLELCGAAYDGVGIPAVIATGRRASHSTRQYLARRGAQLTPATHETRGAISR